MKVREVNKSCCFYVSNLSNFPEANHLRGGYGVPGGVGRARQLAMRRAPGLDDIGEMTMVKVSYYLYGIEGVTILENRTVTRWRCFDTK
ncbi:jg19831 [Pararge aegeria aegeria]|uniref:Jg19831 protein n=1 Tax=Pararge aegeria aegeria TaxID=348720 RepID=A0A8S4SJA6_9NEOP|nr:jg19831 [Pararge aegeria aegeria]